MQKDQPELEGEKEKFIDQATGKRMHEHLTNENDIISEDDIRRVRTDIGNDRATVGKETGEEKASKPQDKEDSNDNIKPGIGSAWDILNE
ncbi:hypothetical protein BH11BAC4_BH11BAC4_24680 [soil metagenome]